MPGELHVRRANRYRRSPMRRPALSLAILLLPALTGCGDPALPHLERLINEWGVVIATGYVHSDAYGKDEQRIRCFHEQSRATNRMLTKFLADDPPVSDELKAFLRNWKTVTAEIEATHKKMIDEGRFTYHEDEKDRAETLTKAEALAGFELMEHLKGY
jgi:hypothetical protein